MAKSPSVPAPSEPSSRQDIVDAVLSPDLPNWKENALRLVVNMADYGSRAKPESVAAALAALGSAPEGKEKMLVPGGGEPEAVMMALKRLNWEAVRVVEGQVVVRLPR